MKQPNHPSKQNIRLATDAVILTVANGELQALLIKMKKRPYGGHWAFPGGLLGDDETSLAAAQRILAAQTGVKEAYLEQLAVFDDPKRDPFGRVASVAYFALVPSEGLALRTTAKYDDVRWWPVHKLPRLAYDHKQVARAAVSRLQEQLEHSAIAWSLLPERFTLSDLQAVHESVLGEPIDKRNFRKKVLAGGLLQPLRQKRADGAHRPAQLYRFRPQCCVIPKG
jgi:8-oxo-dGTP diphosphatase